MSGSSGDFASPGGVLGGIPGAPSRDEEDGAVEVTIDGAWGADSHGSLSLGGYTTITNIADGAAAGPGGNQLGSPSRSVFKFVGAVESPSKPSSPSNEGGSLKSWLDMQKAGPVIPDSGGIRQDAVLRHQESCLDSSGKVEEGGFCDRAECGNVESDGSASGRGSSLSSLTNDFFPRFNGRGAFAKFGKKHTTPSTKETPSPPTSSEGKANPQSPTKGSPKVEKSSRFGPKRKKNNLVQGSPWYQVQLQPQHQLHFPGKHPIHIQQTPRIEPHPQPHGGHLPPPLPVTAVEIHPPREISVSSPKAPKDIVCSPPSAPPSIISSTGISQLFTNELRERYGRNIRHSYGHHYRSCATSSRTKNYMTAAACLSLLVAIVVITALVIGNGEGDQVTQGAAFRNDLYDDALPVLPDELPEKCCMEGYDELDAEGGEDSYDGFVEKPESNQGEDSDLFSETSSSSSPPGGGEASPDLADPAEGEPSPEDVSFAQDQVTFVESSVDTPASATNPQKEPGPSFEGIDFEMWAQNLRPPTGRPSQRPTTRNPTPQPTRQPSRRPTLAQVTTGLGRPPTSRPTEPPSTPRPSRPPSRRPSRRPTTRPTRRPTQRPNPSPARPEPRPVQVSPTTSSVKIKAVDTTINESRPNRNYGAEPYLNIKGSTQVALLKFEVGPVTGYSVSKARLVVYAAASPENRQEGGSGSGQIRVDVLPNAGDWDEASLTYSDGLRSNGSSRAGSFGVSRAGAGDERRRKYEVDVTRAVADLLSESADRKEWYITFRLSTSSGVSVDLASREYEGGAAEAELRLDLSSPEPTRSPSIAPSPSPTVPPVSPPPTDSPVVLTPLPTSKPTESPEASIVTASPTRKLTPPPSLVIYPTCPEKHSTATVYSVGDLASLGYTARDVYKCTLSSCNANNIVPGAPLSNYVGWELTGNCVAPATASPTPPITTSSPSTKPTFSPTAGLEPPSPSPTKVTSSPTSKPSSLATPLPTSDPTKPPTSIPTPIPSPPPSPEPTLKPVTDPPTPPPTVADTPEPTPTPDPTPPSTPEPITPEPTPDPTPEPATAAPVDEDENDEEENPLFKIR